MNQIETTNILFAASLFNRNCTMCIVLCYAYQHQAFESKYLTICKAFGTAAKKLACLMRMFRTEIGHFNGLRSQKPAMFCRHGPRGHSILRKGVYLYEWKYKD